MKHIGSFTLNHLDENYCKNYFTIREYSASKAPISSSIHKLPHFFRNAKNKKVTILNFEAFYPDPNNPNNLLRSDCTELHCNVGFTMNYDNELICLSGRGFCGYLYYDVSDFTMNELKCEYKNPLFPDIHPIYIVVQLLLEWK
jgi:hypothetical protein